MLSKRGIRTFIGAVNNGSLRVPKATKVAIVGCGTAGQSVMAQLLRNGFR